MQEIFYASNSHICSFLVVLQAYLITLRMAKPFRALARLRAIGLNFGLSKGFIYSPAMHEIACICSFVLALAAVIYDKYLFQIRFPTLLEKALKL